MVCFWRKATCAQPRTMNDAVLKTWKREREREKESVRCSSSSLKRSRSFSSEEKSVVVLSKMLYYLVA